MSRRQFIHTASVAGVGAALGASLSDTNADAAPIPNAVPYAAQPIPLSAVRLTGGPLHHAQEMNAQYLLTLEPDGMMAHLREHADLPPKAKGYGGWDGDGKNLTGHIAGHYLSAVSLMYAATGDERFRERARYLVREMDAVQKKNGDGYLGALMDGDKVDGKVRFKELAHGQIRSGGFDLNGLWSPWYVQHKLFAGLRDAYRFTGDRTALDVEKRFAGWAARIVGNIDPAQVQKMLNTEFGGMNEVLVDLYADTGDKQWLALANRFELRGQRYGKSRAAWRWYLLRSQGPAVGQHLRAVHGEMESGERNARGGNQLSRGRHGNPDTHTEVRPVVHAVAKASVVGEGRVQGCRQWGDGHGSARRR